MPGSMRRAARRVDGVVLLNKPRGLSSQTAVTRVRHALQAAKAGHTGTLDPLADGLLPVCLGEATKFAQFALDADKGYRAVVRLGVTTSTGDAEGEVTGGVRRVVAREELEETLARFLGNVQQTPPMYSAVRQDGRRLYELARAGRVVARTPRQIRIERIDLVAYQDDAFEIEVTCGKGTYIRVLAEDIGADLGCGAHLASLTRTQVAGFRLEDAVALETLCAMTPDAAARLLLPLDALVSGLPRVVLDAETTRTFAFGQTVAVSGTGAAEGPARVYAAEGTFLGVGELAGEGKIRPRRLRASGGDCPAR